MAASVGAPDAHHFAAGRDLDAIYDYTADRWGIEQAGRYVGSFGAAYERLLLYPDLGSAAGGSRPYRRLRHESHLIFYRVMGGSLRIERILHHRMDAPRHLS